MIPKVARIRSKCFVCFKFSTNLDINIILAVQHCIWNIQSDSFGALSLSFAKALQASLRTELDEDTKNAWVTLLTTFGSLITDRYDSFV